MLGGVSCEDLLTICGLLAVQCIFGLYMIFLNRLLAAGVPSLFIIVVACAASSVVVLPFAIALERKKWPKEWSPLLIIQLVIISLGGVSIYQVFMMLGVERASPAIASAMPNLGLVLIFIISACLRFERFEWKCKYTRAKILGTLVCLSGAMCLSFIKSPTPSTSPKSIPGDKELSDWKGDKNWILGCLYLLTGVTIFACNTVLQAATLKRFPAPLSVCTITAVMGLIFSAIIQVIMEGKLDAGTADNVASIVGEIVLVVYISMHVQPYLMIPAGRCGDWSVHNIPGVEHWVQGACRCVDVQPVPDRVLGVHLPHLQTMDRPRMSTGDFAHICRSLAMWCYGQRTGRTKCSPSSRHHLMKLNVISRGHSSSDELGKIACLNYWMQFFSVKIAS